MEVTLLCVGDVVGSPGRHVLREALETLVPKLGIDCVIVNGENAAGGSGLTPTLYEKFLKYGVDVITLGDHIYRRRELIAVLEKSNKLVKPANYPLSAPGKTYAIHETKNNQRIAVISLMGRLFMRPNVNCPYATIDQILGGLPKDIKIIVVDMHAEATSEKVSMGWHLDGRVSLMFGTHTHIPTADERILHKGTAYITDLGMTGPYDSVLGRDKKRVISAMMTNVPVPFDVATDEPKLCGVLVKVESTTGKATHIERITFNGSNEPAG